jgi:hypothetical protein
VRAAGYGWKFDFVYGLESMIPVCCAAEFCLRLYLLKNLRVAATTNLSAIDTNFVPCFMHRWLWRDDRGPTWA